MQKFSDIKLTAKFTEFFPATDPDTPWLLRLMILRDDINHEFFSLPLRENDDNDKVWRNTYFLRRLTVSLVEVRSIFEFNLGKLVKKTESPLLKEFLPYLQSALKIMKSANDQLITIRDSIGGHLRPQSVDKHGECVVGRFLTSFPSLEGTVKVSVNNLQDSSFRTLTSNSVLLTSPDAQTEEELQAHHISVRDTVMKAAPSALAAIDALLIWFWIKNGVYQAPTGSKLVVINQETGEMKDVPPAV